MASRRPEPLVRRRRYGQVGQTYILLAIRSDADD